MTSQGRDEPADDRKQGTPPDADPATDSADALPVPVLPVPQLATGLADELAPLGSGEYAHDDEGDGAAGHDSLDDGPEREQVETLGECDPLDDTAELEGAASQSLEFGESTVTMELGELDVARVVAAAPAGALAGPAAKSRDDGEDDGGDPDGDGDGEDGDEDCDPGGEDDAPHSGRPLSMCVEAVLFAATDPVSMAKLRSLLGNPDPHELRSVVEALAATYEATGRAFLLEEVAGGFQLRTRPEFSELVTQSGRRTESTRLSAAALESLAIVAYRQPVLRADIEKIRGVASGEVLRSLIERELVRVMGRAELPGSPLLYGTTPRFLELFGLRNIRDLPRDPELLRPL